MGSKKKKGGQAAPAEPMPQTISKSTSFTITTDYGDQLHIAQPKHARGKMKAGYAGWISAISRANRMLPHDTKDASAFMLRIVDHITEIYSKRKSLSHTYGTNPLVMGMQARLKLIHGLFEIDPSPEGKWAVNLPDQAEVYALAFSAWGFKLDKALSRLFELWGIGDWARLPDTNAVKKAAADFACEGETACRDMGNGGDTAELAARVSRLESEQETDAICHQAAREENKAQINQLIEVVAYLCDHINQVDGVMPSDEAIKGYRRDPTVAPADLLKYMAKSARSMKEAVEPKAGSKRKRGASDDGEDFFDPFVAKKSMATDAARHSFRKGKFP